MAEWEFAGRTYRFTSAEFREKKRKYREKYGTAVYVPGFEDIVHFKRFTPMTAEEKRLWRGRHYSDIPKERREEIIREKARKKEKFLAMLASPSPDIANNVGTILTALDDAQDAIATLACVGTIAAKLGGKTLMKVLAPGIGWAWLASDIMNMINPFSRARKWWKADSSGREPKRLSDKLTELNPSTKKGKRKTLRRIRKWAPTSANICEASQTADQLFGVGLSFGPVVGFAQDLLFAGARQQAGEFVDLKFTPRARSEWWNAALGALKSNVTLGLCDLHSDPKDIVDLILSQHLASEVVYPHAIANDTMSIVENTKDVLYHAPEPTDTLTLEIMDEVLPPNDRRIGLPGIGGTTAPLTEIEKEINRTAVEKYERWARANKWDLECYVASQCASQCALNCMMMYDMDGVVESDYTVQCKVRHKIYNNGWMYPDDISEPQVNKFMAMTDDWERQGYNPTSREIQALAALHCGFQFVPAVNMSGW